MKFSHRSNIGQRVSRLHLAGYKIQTVCNCPKIHTNTNTHNKVHTVCNRPSPSGTGETKRERMRAGILKHIGARRSGKVEQSTHCGIIVACIVTLLCWCWALLWSATLGQATLGHSRYNCGMQPQMPSPTSADTVQMVCCSETKTVGIVK